MLCGTWWSTTTGMVLLATTRRWLIFWSQLQWLGIAFIPVCWLLFTLEYTGRDEYVTFRTAVSLSILPSVSLSLALTTGVHDLLYSEMTVATDGAATLLALTPGPWFWIHVVYSNVLLLTGTVLIVQLAVGTHRRYLGQAAALLGIVLLPWIASIANAFEVTPVAHLDPTPLTFVVTGVAGIVALRRYDVLDAIPVTDRVAQQSLIDSMEDGVVVVDERGRIADANPEARRILDVDAPLQGNDVNAVVEQYDQITRTDDEQVRIDLADGNTDRIYEIQVTPLDGHDESGGKILIFNDVTERQTRLQRLDVLNRVLRHNLRNEMNVVYGYADRIVTGGDAVEPEAVAERIKEKSMSLVDLGDKAREIDEILSSQGDDADVVEVATLLEWEEARASNEHPDIDIECVCDDVEGEACNLALGTVLKILVENAVEHNDASEPFVRVTATAELHTVVVTVTDNGPGIPEDEQAVLDAGEETKLKHGSGLGLWLANWGVQALSGDLSIEGDSRDGAIVHVSVPRIEESDPRD
jgi:signal transduction histidine kinase